MSSPSTSRYHEWLKPETPRPENLWRYLQVAARSAAFSPGATDAVDGKNELAVMWLEHLLVLSMLQHPGGEWAWGRYVVVYPAGNSDLARGCARYQALLKDRATFAHITTEELLDENMLPPEVTRRLQERYFPEHAGHGLTPEPDSTLTVGPTAP